METIEAISKRVSIRKYKADQISEDDLQTILKAGMSAPVGSGAYDSLHITVCQNIDLLNQIGNEVTNMVEKLLGKRLDKNFGAPTMIIISSKPGMMPGIEMANAGTVLENMAIAATSLGIDNIVWGGAVAIANQNEEIRNKLEIPEGFKSTLAISLGYAVEKEAAKEHVISVNRV